MSNQRTRNRPLSVGIVGLGTIAAEHIAGWVSVGAEIIATVDPFRSASPACPIHYSSLANMLSSETPDVIDICTPHHLHWPQLKSVWKAKCAVLIEKPVIVDPAHILALQELWKTRVGATIMRTNKRFEPHVIRFLDAFRTCPDEKFNVQITWQQRPEYMRRRRWYRRSEVSGGGVVLGMGIHLFDLIAEYIPEAQLVNAVLKVNTNEPNDSDTTAENYAQLGFKSPRVDMTVNLSCCEPVNRPYECFVLEAHSGTTTFTREPLTPDTISNEFKYYARAIGAKARHPAPGVVCNAHTIAFAAYSLSGAQAGEREQQDA